MRLSDALKDKLMDVRLRDKWLDDGKITKEELDEYLKSLPDDGSKLTYTDSHVKADVPQVTSH